MAKHFLYLTDYYYPVPTSIGVCSDAIIRKLIDNGNAVDVVCFGDNTNKNAVKIDSNLRVFHVKDRLWEIMQRGSGNFTKKKGRLLCRGSQLLMMHYFPMTSISVPFRYLKVVEDIYDKNKHDEVVSTYAPFEACWTAFKLKQKYPEVRWSIYILDTFTNRGASKFFSEKWNDVHGWRWEKKFFSLATKIINLRCHEEHHLQSRYDQYREKMFFVDIPLFDPYKFNEVKPQLYKETLSFVYTGRIDRHWYSPVKMCELFRKISQGKDWKLHFFGNPTDCENYLNEMNSITDGKIIMEGFVSRKRVEYALTGADVLVSFCHMDSDKVQSKIFDYMSTGAKIIHLTDNVYRDSARDYYKKYDNAFIIDDTECDDKVVLEKLILFLEDGMRISALGLEELFIDNRPETTARILEL